LLSRLPRALLAFGAINYDNDKDSTDLVRGIPLLFEPFG
jgi:hypothetical protein